jgi:nicotinamide mononucleotide transporter
MHLARQPGKISNYAFGLINVTLFAIIFFQIQLYASLLLQLFFFAANIYGWYAWSRQTPPTRPFCKSAGCLCRKP